MRPTLDLSGRVLHYFYALGCVFCEEAEPEVMKLQRKHPTLMVIRHNFKYKDSLYDWQPKGTPAYGVVSAGKVVKRHNGALSFGELEAFIKLRGE